MTKKEIINRVMYLLRCKKITTATPNREVWKFFEKDLMEEKNKANEEDLHHHCGADAGND